MTTTDVNLAIESLLKDKKLREDLEIDKKEAYELRHRRTLAYKLEVLFKAGKLKLNNGK